MQKLSTSWNIRIVADIFALFCLHYASVPWKLRAAKGYKLAKPISQKVRHLLYVDDLKVYVASENKLQRMMKNVKDGMCIHDISEEVWSPMP